MHRRTFLQTLPAAAVAAASPPPGDVPVKLGFDTYSIRAFQWKAPQFLEYAHNLKLDTIQFSSMGDYDSYEPPYLEKVKDTAARYNISIDAGMGCVCPSSKSFNKNGPPARETVGVYAATEAAGAAMRKASSP